MQLSSLFEAAGKPYSTDEGFIRRALDDITDFSEHHDWKFSSEPGVIESATLYDKFLKIPGHWTRIPVKFGSFPNASVGVYNNNKLGSLENLPDTVKDLTLQNVNGIASLRGCSRVVNNVLLVAECGVTSLAGAPERVRSLELMRLSKLINLRGLEHLELESLIIDRCELHSLEGVPKFIEQYVLIAGDTQLKAIKFPSYFSMGENSEMYISSNFAHKLSPTLVMIPGLTAIDWSSDTVNTYNQHILDLFNEHLEMPKTKKTYLRLCTALIDNDLEHLADL